MTTKIKNQMIRNKTNQVKTKTINKMKKRKMIRRNKRPKII